MFFHLCVWIVNYFLYKYSLFIKENAIDSNICSINSSHNSFCSSNIYFHYNCETFFFWKAQPTGLSFVITFCQLALSCGNDPHSFISIFVFPFMAMFWFFPFIVFLNDQWHFIFKSCDGCAWHVCNVFIHKPIRVHVKTCISPRFVVILRKNNKKTSLC